MPRTALFPGTFDPVTNGHLDVVRQAARLADHLLLAIGTHPGKTPLFTAKERLAMLEETCAPIARAAGTTLRCLTFADLVVAAARREGAPPPRRAPASSPRFKSGGEVAGKNDTGGRGVKTFFLPPPPVGPPDHRHTGQANRLHGRRCVGVRATVGGSPPESE